MYSAEVQHRYYETHKAQVAEKRRAYYAKNADEIRAKGRDRMRAYNLKKLGITPTRPAPELCEICGKAPSGKGCAAVICMDHDHKTGKFRGWLCSLCNSALGKFEDSPETLKRAINYLQENG